MCDRFKGKDCDSKYPTRSLLCKSLSCVFQICILSFFFFNQIVEKCLKGVMFRLVMVYLCILFYLLSGKCPILIFFS